MATTVLQLLSANFSSFEMLRLKTRACWCVYLFLSAAFTTDNNRQDHVSQIVT